LDYSEIIFWILSIIVSFILGYLTNWYFYRKQQKETKANSEVLKQLKQHSDAEILLGNDKRGKIVKKQDGTITIDWTVELVESAVESATPKAEVEKREK
jgi:preprotein translocase subunit YajC